jgi:hypothetical protein
MLYVRLRLNLRASNGMRVKNSTKISDSSRVWLRCPQVAVPSISSCYIVVAEAPFM